MVRSGWALSFVGYSHAYDSDEVQARSARKRPGLEHSLHLGTGVSQVRRASHSLNCYKG